MDPEQLVWIAVLEQHVRDACFLTQVREDICLKSSRKYKINVTNNQLVIAKAARDFINKKSLHYNYVCSMANIDPDWFIEKAWKKIGFQDERCNLYIKLKNVCTAEDEKTKIAYKSRIKNAIMISQEWNKRNWCSVSLVYTDKH